MMTIVDITVTKINSQVNYWSHSLLLLFLTALGQLLAQFCTALATLTKKLSKQTWHIYPDINRPMIRELTTKSVCIFNLQVYNKQVVIIFVPISMKLLIKNVILSVAACADKLLTGRIHGFFCLFLVFAVVTCCMERRFTFNA